MYPSSEFIKTTREIEELWNWLGYLSSPQNVKDVLLEKISQNRFTIIYDRILKKGAAGFSLITKDAVEKNAERIARYVEQSRDLFQAARNVSEIASPILYYFGMLSLAKALILSTYDVNGKDNPFRKHGLHTRGETHDQVQVKPFGVFPSLHNCYSDDLELYLNETEFSLKDLLSTNPELGAEYRLTYREEPRFSGDLKGELDVELGKYTILPINGRTLHLIDSIFMTTYILCSKARYKPEHWIKEITSDKRSFILQSFLMKAERRFPNLILNEIMMKRFLFAPAARSG
jgi:hypothetical protein